MIDEVNRHRDVHVVTIEDPIEIIHHDNRALINQREVRIDTADFKVAMRSAMRQDPDVILIGEMRDTETVHAALSAAETGHLVLSTLHTVDAQETISRIIDFFPPLRAAADPAVSGRALRGILCQRLVQGADNRGRCVAMEICINTGRVGRHRGQGQDRDDHVLIAEGVSTGCRPSTSISLSCIATASSPSTTRCRHPAVRMTSKWNYGGWGW